MVQHAVVRDRRRHVLAEQVHRVVTVQVRDHVPTVPRTAVRWKDGGRMHRLSDRKLLVVDGTRAIDDPDAPIGNGRAISILAAARVQPSPARTSIRSAAGNDRRPEIEADGGTATPIVADVADPGQCAQMVDESAIEALGGLDGIVLNVGSGWARVLRARRRGLGLAINVNLRSHFLVLQGSAAADGRRRRDRLPQLGRRLRAGSGSPRMTPQGGDPWAVPSRRAGGREAADPRERRGPGLMDTPIGRAATSENPNRDRIAAIVPLGRQGTAWEVAAATVFLLSRGGELHHRPAARGRRRADDALTKRPGTKTL